jgi:SAM-dependent methyltransferase
MKRNAPVAGLGQHGRAGVDMLGSMQKFASSQVRAGARVQFEASDGAPTLAAGAPANDRASIMDWVHRARDLAEQQPLYRLERFMQAYVALGIYDFGIPAVEANRDRFSAETDPIADDSIEITPDLVIPDYFECEWHLRPGGWDGYDLYGPHGLHVVKPIFALGGFAAAPVGSNIGQQRLDAIAQLPRRDYQRIYEPGCGSGSTLVALQKTFPDAQIIGSDLSVEQLRAARRLTDKLGIRATLRQRDAATDTGEPDESVDAVMTYALHHELPYSANVALLAEMFRILKPGGDIVLTDPPPFRAVDPFHAALLDWDTDNRAEPFFSEACASNWAAELEKVGFVGAKDYAIGPDRYPWITRATKPGA